MTPDFIPQFLSRAEALEPRALAAVRDLSPGQLAARPPAGGWSIAEIFEHLCLTSESYDPVLARAFERARARSDTPRPVRGTFMGTLLRKALMESNRQSMPAPRVWVPLAPRERVVESFLLRVRGSMARLREAEGLDTRVMLASPAAWFLRMNLAEALALEVVHAERHLGQIERVRASLAR
ncbi:MAG: DinB family protein [Candidatus Eisenbacteria bacterium]